jgi:hypothetical protein
MKSLAFLIVLFWLLPFTVTAQVIPNGGFESWSITNGWTEEPDGWETPNNQLIESTVKDPDAYAGLYAMRVNPAPNGIGEEGFAWIEIPTDFIPPSLDFYAKWSRTLTASVGVEIQFFNNELQVYAANWVPEDTSSAWTYIHLPLEQIEPVMTHMIIRAYIFIGDFAPGSGWISVDEMSFGNPNGLNDLDESNIGLYPNPTSDVLKISVKVQPLDYSIIDSSGRLVDQGTFKSEIDVSQLPVANYTLQLRMRDGSLVEKRFQVER